MEIIVTRLATEADLFEFSASRAERGENAGPETWANANEEAADTPLVTDPDDIEYVRDYFGEFGAWDDAERATWTPTEVNALLIQYLSGDLREMKALAPGDGPGDIDWDAAEVLQREGTVSGNLFCTGAEVYAYIGS